MALAARCLRVERRTRLRVVLAGDESFLDPETEYLKLLSRLLTIASEVSPMCRAARQYD